MKILTLIVVALFSQFGVSAQINSQITLKRHQCPEIKRFKDATDEQIRISTNSSKASFFMSEHICFALYGPSLNISRDALPSIYHRDESLRVVHNYQKAYNALRSSEQKLNLAYFLVKIMSYRMTVIPVEQVAREKLNIAFVFSLNEKTKGWYELDIMPDVDYQTALDKLNVLVDNPPDLAQYPQLVALVNEVLDESKVLDDTVLSQLGF